MNNGQLLKNKLRLVISINQTTFCLSLKHEYHLFHKFQMQSVTIDSSSKKKCGTKKLVMNFNTETFLQVCSSVPRFLLEAPMVTLGIWSTVRAPVSGMNQNSAGTRIWHPKALQRSPWKYINLEWFVITLYVAGLLHPVIF